MATQNTSNPESGTSASERFFRYFQHEITALQDQMARLGDTALIGGERKDATDHCLAGITRLSSEVKDASQTLPSYDLRTYSEAVKALQDKLAETQAQFAPKQKFSFKTRKNASAVSINDAAELAAQKQKTPFGFNTASEASSFATTPIHLMTPPNELNTAQQVSSKESDPKSTVRGGPSDGAKSTVVATEQSSSRDHAGAPGLTTTSTFTSVASQINSHVVLPASASRVHTPCTLSNLEACCVDLSVPTTETAPFASLMINDIKSSLLLCGSVDGPAHITNVQNSTILISCRQFRMHECRNVDIYLYCTSRPIIEDCHELRFAEMATFYTDLLHSAHSTSNQAIGTNMWEQVDDFKWLRSEQSPNWSMLPLGDRVSESVWKALITAQKSMSLGQILETVSIKK